MGSQNTKTASPTLAQQLRDTAETARVQKKKNYDKHLLQEYPEEYTKVAAQIKQNCTEIAAEGFSFYELRVQNENYRGPPKLVGGNMLMCPQGSHCSPLIQLLRADGFGTPDGFNWGTCKVWFG